MYWDISEANGLAWGIMQLHIIILTATYLLLLALKTEDFQLSNHSFFIIACGILIYFTFNIIISSLINISPDEDLLFLWTFKQSSLILFYIFISFVFLKSK